MISKKMLDALNVQIKEELASAYLYLAMSADFSDKDLPGFAQWMKMQYGEEMAHAFKLYGYILERGGKPILEGLAKPQSEWDSPLAAFEAAYKHEQYITGCIHNLVKLARDENDTATEVFLQWFVTEQVEEEASADEVIRKIKLSGADKPGHILYMLDKEMAARGVQ
jgi:ferritin